MKALSDEKIDGITNGIIMVVKVFVTTYRVHDCDVALVLLNVKKQLVSMRTNWFPYFVRRSAPSTFYFNKLRFPVGGKKVRWQWCCVTALLLANCWQSPTSWGPRWSYRANIIPVPLRSTFCVFYSISLEWDGRPRTGDVLGTFLARKFEFHQQWWIIFVIDHHSRLKLRIRWLTVTTCF